MPLILSDPLNIKEWSDVKATTHFPSMSVYFAYQSFAGAIMHLVIGVVAWSYWRGIRQNY